MAVPIVTVYTRVTCEDASGIITNMEVPPVRFGLGVTNAQAPIDQEYSIAGSTFQALTVPAGARFVVIRTTAPSLVLKGVTGDGNGLALTPASNGLPVDWQFPVSSPTMGILNSGATAAAVRVVWF